MGWEERLKEAAYTSPLGTRTVFLYENVSRSVDKHTTAFDFPDAEGTYVQDFGRSSRRYPLRIFFTGDDYDLDVTAFEETLVERGIGILEHPSYGKVNVVPFGTIERRDDLKTATNQAVIQVSFWETIGLIFPTSQSDPASDVLVAVDEYNVVAAKEFEESVGLDTAVERATVKDSFQKLKGQVVSALEKIAATTDKVKKQFDAINSSIDNSIDLLIGEPLSLAFQTTQLIQSPARALTSFTARLDAYLNLGRSIIRGGDAVSTNTKDDQGLNQFITRDLHVSGAVTGTVLSAVNHTFTTKTGAIEAAEVIVANYEEVVAWQEANFQGLGVIDTGESYQKLQQAVFVTVGFLVEISFTLKQERILVLEAARTPIDLVAELLGSVDDELDDFIASNKFTGTEILEISKGRRVRYYI